MGQWSVRPTVLRSVAASALHRTTSKKGGGRISGSGSTPNGVHAIDHMLIKKCLTLLQGYIDGETTGDRYEGSLQLSTNMKVVCQEWCKLLAGHPQLSKA
jgi:hypothetical protein